MAEERYCFKTITFRIPPQRYIREKYVMKALQADKGKYAQLINWYTVDFTKKGDNFASFVTSIVVTYSLDGVQEESTIYVVKLNPCRGYGKFDIFTEHIFKKEVGFYMDLLPELNLLLVEHNLRPLSFPKCYTGTTTSMKQQIYFVDMRRYGFKNFDKRKGMDPAHACLVLIELGRLHATSMVLENRLQEPLDNQYEFLKNADIFMDNEHMIAMMQGHVTTAMDTLARVGGYDSAISWASSIKPRVKEILTSGQLGGKFNVIIHGDCWNDNIIFKYNDVDEPVDVTLLDLQGCRRASCACDLNYFFYTSLNGDVRKSNFNSFLKIYYSSFQNVIETAGMDMPFTMSELIQEFRDKNELGGLFGMMVIPFILFEPENVLDMREFSDEDLENLRDNVKAKTLEMVDDSPLMKPRFLSMFDDFMESGLIS